MNDSDVRKYVYFNRPIAVSTVTPAQRTVVLYLHTVEDVQSDECNVLIVGSGYTPVLAVRSVITECYRRPWRDGDSGPGATPQLPTTLESEGWTLREVATTDEVLIASPCDGTSLVPVGALRRESGEQAGDVTVRTRVVVCTWRRKRDAAKFSEIFKAMRAEAVRDLEELADELEREDCAADPELN